MSDVHDTAARAVGRQVAEDLAALHAQDPEMTRAMDRFTQLSTMAAVSSALSLHRIAETLDHLCAQVDDFGTSIADSLSTLRGE